MRVFLKKFRQYLEKSTNAFRIKQKDKTGFTLAEVLIVVAIMSILAGFGFVALNQYNKRLTLLEMDDTAKKIFLAAQNHLTVSDTSGAWKQLVTESGAAYAKANGKSLGKLTSYTSSDGYNKYFVIYGGKSSTTVTDGNAANDAKEAANLILPPNVVNIAGDGSYAILYNAETATIYGVYYSSSSTFGNSQDGETYSFSQKIEEDLKKTDGNSLRGSVDNRKKESVLIGYYGNATGTSKTPGTELKALEKINITFINDKKSLRLQVTDPNKLSLDNMTIQIEGKESGQIETFKYAGGKLIPETASIARVWAGNPVKTVDGGSNQITTVIFDQISTDSSTPVDLQHGNLHFANLLPDFYYGEDISATVSLANNDTRGGTQVISGTASANSLFEQIYKTDGTKNLYAARISNIRHFENLSTEISGITSYSGADNSSYALFSIKKAILTKNFDFSSGSEDSKDLAAGFSSGSIVYAYSSALNPKSETLSDVQNGENFIGITPDAGFMIFDGNGNKLTSLHVVGTPLNGNSSTKGTGLFTSFGTDDTASLDTSFSLSNFILEKSNIQTGVQNQTLSAGPLIGYFKGKSLSINNVLINGNPENIYEKSGKVNGKAHAGGMIGQIDGINGCKVDIWNSQVSGNRVISESGNAGGFIGYVSGLTTAEDTGSLTIAQCKFTEPINIDPNGSGNENNNDIYAAFGSAGGLVGSFGYKEIKNNKSVITPSYWNFVVSNCDVSSEHRFNITGIKQTGGLIGGFYGGNLRISGTLVAGKYMWIQNKSTGGNTDGSCAGGFIGEGNIKPKASASIQNCGANAYVYAVDADCAGGLIGSLKSGSSSSIKDTYVGGHTSNGQYLDKTYDGTTNSNGGYNIFGCTATGGFIGYTSANNLTVENCSTTASTYTNTQLDSKHRHGIIGGFVGQTQYAVTTYFNYCYAAGKTFSNGENYAGYGGSFIGQINNKEKKKINNHFLEDYVLKGVDFNEGQTYGGETTNTLSDSDDKKMLNEQIHAVTTSKLRTLKFYKPVEKTDAYDLPYLKGKPYPYSITAKLPDYTNNQYDSVYCKRWYVGDWAEPKAEERDQTYDGNFGVLYYEIVQHGDTGTKDYYYHGFVGSLTEDGSRKDYQEVYTNDVDGGIWDRPNNGKGLLTGHNEYVVEEGYLVLVSKKYSKDHVKEWRNQNNQLESNELAIYITTPGTGIDYGLARIGNNPYVKTYDGLGDHLHIKGYDVYCIDSEKLTDLGAQSSYLNVALKAYINDTKNPNGNEPIEWARFYFQPIFSDTLSLNDDPSPDEYKIRSAKQMKLIFEKGGNTYNAINNSHRRVKQTLDISFSKELQFSKFDWETGGQKLLSSEDSDYINKSDNPYNSATINQPMNFTYYASTPYDERSDTAPADQTDDMGNGDGTYYRLQNINRPFSEGSIGNPGLIEKLIIENADTSYFLEGNLEGTLNQCKFINCLFTEAPIKKVQNGSVTKCDVINGQMGRAGLIETMENAANVSHCHIYGDENIVQGNNKDEYPIHNTGFMPNMNTLDADAQRDPKYGYNLVTVGVVPNTKPDEGTNSTNGGLIAECKTDSGTIEDCSFTGKVYGNIAAGFMGKTTGNGITIKRCYANALVTGYERAGGLIGEASKATIDQCHTVGIIKSNRGANGFVANFFGGSITNSYSAIWKAEVGTGFNYYPFSDSANGQYSLSNCYATNDAGGVQTSGYTVVTDDKLKKMTGKTSGLGVAAGSGKTVPYYQYLSNDENTYPFPMPEDDDGELDTAYGDWYYQNIIFTATDRNGQEVNLDHLVVENDAGIIISVKAVQSGKNISGASNWMILQNGASVNDAVATIAKETDHVTIALKQLGTYSIYVFYNGKTATQLCNVRKISGLQIKTEPAIVLKGTDVTLKPQYTFTDGTSSNADIAKLQWTVSYNGGSPVSVTPDTQGKITMAETGSCLITATDTMHGVNSNVTINVLDESAYSANDEVELLLTYSGGTQKQYNITLKNTANHKVNSITVTLEAQNVKEIGGNVTGSVNGNIATITSNNYGKGFAPGASATFYMTATGNSDNFSLHVPASQTKQNVRSTSSEHTQSIVTNKIKVG